MCGPGPSYNENVFCLFRSEKSLIANRVYGGFGISMIFFPGNGVVNGQSSFLFRDFARRRGGEVGGGMNKSILGV